MFKRKFQMGGPAPQGQDPMQVLLQAAQQAVQGQDCEIAMQVCQMLIEAVGGAQAAPAETPAPQEEPVYKKGGRLVRRIKA